MTVTLLAPAANEVFMGRHGFSYTSDAYAIINAQLSDVNDLLAAGCFYPPASLAGRDNAAATTAPTTSNDSTQDFAVGSRWIDTTNKMVYVCMDATASAAVWKRLGGPGVINVTAATLTVTAAAHAGKLITLNKANGQTLTFPAATGTGDIYEFFLGTTVTSVGTVLQVANSTDIIQGEAIQAGSAGATTTFIAGASDDTITLNGSTTGGFKGDLLRLIDASAGVFSLQAITKITGSAATPFSSAV